MNLQNKFGLIGIITVLFFASSCKKSEENILPEPQVYVGNTFIGEYSKQSVAAQASSLGVFAQYDVQVYKVTYKTKDVDGNTITASGAMILPKNQTNISLLSYQHGTIINENDAPSYYKAQTEASTIGAFLASAGYVVAIPDYIGYGASNSLAHPYEHSASLASASLDMLRAVKEYCERNGIQLNGRLFLTGYSEGGNATMSLHKMIEEQASSEFKVTASAPGAGGYDKTAFTQYIVSKNENLEFLPYYVWVLDSYNKIYKLNRAYTAYFTQPDAGNIAALAKITGIFGITISKNPQVLFTSGFRNGITNKTDTEFLGKVALNNVYDWKPLAPIRMFHGTADDFVPIFNSENALNAMKARGATNVELTRIQGGNHDTAVASYAFGVFFYFNDLNK